MDSILMQCLPDDQIVCSCDCLLYTSVERLRNAIAQAEAYGFLGEDILGTGFNFRLHINQGAGAFALRRRSTASGYSART